MKIWVSGTVTGVWGKICRFSFPPPGMIYMLDAPVYRYKRLNFIGYELITGKFYSHEQMKFNYT